MRIPSRIQRLHCESAIRAGIPLTASAQQSHYLRNVLRMRSDDEILIFNGSDGEWLARLRIDGRRQTLLEPVRLVRPQPPAPDLHFLFAPIKAGRLDWLVQKATEMGAGVLRPVLTRHTQPVRFAAERMRANVIEAAEQCGVLSVPSISPPARLERVLEEWDGARALVFCDEAAEARNPLAALEGVRGRPAAILVGPEGGFSQEEREALLRLPFVTAISLGPRILRADTAAVAALAVFQAAAGDWRADIAWGDSV
jgi:16S rRNA (uracil1498-N3)-methyltransferase